MKHNAYRILPTSLKDDRDAIRFYGTLFPRNALVFDVGANVGIKTKSFLGAGARVICIEPLDLAAAELRFVFGRDSRVTIVQTALAASVGRQSFFRCLDDPGLSSLSQRWVQQGPYAKKSWSEEIVRTSTLDALINKYGLPRYCKIDTEGYEPEILRGLSYQIPIISIEFHKEMISEAVDSVNYLMSIGRYQFNLTRDDSTWFERHEWLSHMEIIDLISSEPILYGEIYARVGERTSIFE